MHLSNKLFEGNVVGNNHVTYAICLVVLGRWTASDIREQFYHRSIISNSLTYCA